MFYKPTNSGGFDSPFRDVGMEFEPIGGKPAQPGFVLHEVGYWGGNEDWSFRSVAAPFWRIYYHFEPGHRLRFGDREIPLGPDRLVVIPGHQRFTYLGDQPAPCLWLAFSVERQVEASQPMPITIEKRGAIGGFVDELRALFGCGRHDRREAVRQTGVAFVYYILVQPEICWQAPLPEHIANVVTLVERSPASSWSNEAMARMAGMNRDAFTRSFRQWVHDTPAKYVQRVRIGKACALLAGSDLPIPEIAVRVGFANRFHFSRVFKSQTGLSPARYRREAGSVHTEPAPARARC